MKKSILIFLTLLLPLAAGCSSQPFVKHGFALDTAISIAVYSGGGEIAAEAAFRRIEELERVFSRTDPQSEVWALNHAGGAWREVSPELREVLDKSLYYSELSGGRFDVTICPVVELWNLGADNPAVPSPNSIRAALRSVGYSNIELNGNSVRLLNGAELDFGAIAKGYIADQAADCLRENGVTSAIVNLGGNVRTVGKKSLFAAFKIGVQKPFEAGGKIIGTVESEDSSVVTSGVYERFFRQDGKLYHHILDTATGMPVDNGLVSVTVLSKDSVDGDALTTVLFTMGPDEGLALATRLDGVEALFVTADGGELSTPGFGLAVAA